MAAVVPGDADDAVAMLDNELVELYRALVRPQIERGGSPRDSDDTRNS